MATAPFWQNGDVASNARSGRMRSNLGEACELAVVLENAAVRSLFHAAGLHGVLSPHMYVCSSFFA